MGAGQNPASGAHSAVGLADGFLIDFTFGLRLVFTVARGLSPVAVGRLLIAVLLLFQLLGL